MAKLGAYYGLCPLIDHRSLLGISKDEENGVVTVTLGKNIAIKFKLSDQKQLYSWRTKEKFSSPIIYDKQQSQYVAVFNESFVRSWSGNEEFLDKLKKLKFNCQIYTIFLCNEKTFIVFKNGAVNTLTEAIQNRRDFSPEKVIDVESEYISEVLYCSLNEQTYVGLIVKSDEHYKLYWTKFNEAYQQDKIYKIALHRENVNLSGYLFHLDRNSVYFLSIWSDGRMYSLELKESDIDSVHIGELYTVIESISCKDYVSAISLDQNYIAVYGCNSNEEGALLVIYNVQFKVVQSKQPFKLFTSGAKMWCIDGNLFFPVGQNLAVIPFYLDTEQLAALVGSHKVTTSEPDPDVSIVQKIQFASWNKNSKSNEDNLPEYIKPNIQDFVSQGFSESVTFETLLPDLLEHKNVQVLSQAIQYFADIPENSLVKIIKLVLNLDGKVFKKSSTNMPKGYPQKLYPLERSELLDILFTKPFNETLFLPHLRSVLNLDESLLLLQYVYFLLSEDGHCLPSLSYIETEARLIEWSCILLDANYQKFLLTKDDKITEILVSLKDLIKEQVSCSDEMREVASLLGELKRGTSNHKTTRVVGLDYSIEEFPLY